MNKFEARLQPSKKITGALRKGLAVSALSVTAALAPGVVTAQAEKGTVEKLKTHIPTKVLEKQATQSLHQQRDLVAFNGILLFESAYNNGGSQYNPMAAGGNVYTDSNVTKIGEGIEHPVVVFRGNPKNEFGHNDLTNGDYTFGEIDRPTGKVKLINFDPKTMKLVPWTMEGSDGPLLENFIFQSDKAGNLNFDEPLTSSDNRTRLHGGPLSDATGQPWQVGLEVSPKG